MIHRLMYQFAGILFLLATATATSKPSVAFLCVVNGLLSYVFAYVKEHQYHTALFNKFLAEQQQKKPH